MIRHCGGVRLPDLEELIEVNKRKSLAKLERKQSSRESKSEVRVADAR